MFKVKNKNTFIPFSSVSIVAFEQVSWEVLGLLRALYRIHRGTLPAHCAMNFISYNARALSLTLF